MYFCTSLGRSENGKVLFYDRCERTKGRVKGDNKRGTTRCAGGIGARLESCIALYSVNMSYFLFEERGIVAT